MEDQTLEDLISSPNPLSTIITKSRKLAEYYSMFSNPQEVKYYSQFPQIQASFTHIQSQISDLIKDVGSFVGCEVPNKTNIKLAGTVEIIDQYSDNIEIKIKKFQDEEQKIRIKQKHPEKVVKQIKPQKVWDLKKPKRVTQQAQFDFSTINHQNTITPAKDIKTTSFTYVDTVQKFSEMIQILLQQKQIAVDLEHSDKSYTGFTCLIQISSRDQDFIVDVFPLWSKITELNKIFNNPSIVKVLHGAYMDVKWLHRDFDIKITNLFDTFHASQHLKNQQNSYAYLLKHYCGVETNKKYQMADWRERPLNEEMLLYAKIDTHYLLEIFDRMKVDIFEQAVKNKMDGKEALNSVFANSKDVTETFYGEGDFREAKYYQQTMARQRASYPEKRCKMLEKLYEIRDRLAQEEDENSERLIPVKYLYELADKKEFIYSEILKTFRKNPEAKEYVAKICLQMTEYLKTLEAESKDAEFKQKGIVIQKQTTPFYDHTNKTNETQTSKQMQVENDYEDFYYQLDVSAHCTLKQHPNRSLKLKTSKAMLMFECPLRYQLKKFEST